MNNTKYGIFANIGGFMNHVRWLLLLDPTFQLGKLKLTPKLYLLHKGSSWPEWEDYSEDLLKTLPIEIQEEIITKTAWSTIDFDTDRINFITNKVYPKSRTYHNWLVFEWQFRFSFNTLIYVQHEIDDFAKNLEKILILETSGEFAYHMYFKFNSNLNIQEKRRFIENHNYTMSNNQTYVEQHNLDYLTINSEVLFNEVLDYDFYQKIIKFFDLSDQYHDAAIIHKLWYQGHRRSEEDFVKEVLRLYNRV